MDDNIIVELYDHKNGKKTDLSVSVDITALEFFTGLNSAFGWGIDLQDTDECYLAAENPIALLRGNRTLREFGLRNGSQIHFVRQ